MRLRLRRRVVFRLILVFFVLGCLDLAAYVGLKAINRNRNLFYDKSRELTRDRIRFWIENSYDPELGWDLPHSERNNLGARRIRSDSPVQDSYKVKMFGDSFTYGAEVGPEESIAAFVESLTPWQALNFGVGAYGTDQAFLKYRKNGLRSEYTVLGLQCENIGRVVSRYTAYYMRDWSPPKPRFIVVDDKVELLANPIPRPEDGERLLDPGFVAGIRAHDYWPRYYESVLGAPARLSWPASRTVLPHLPFFWNRLKLEIKRRSEPTYETECGTYKYFHLYQEPSEALPILTWIVDQFVALAKERGEHPILLVFPDQSMLDIMKRFGKVPYEPLIRHLAARGYDSLDFGPLFLKQDYARLFVAYNRHFSPMGNELIARELIALIHALDLRKGR